MRPKRIPRRRDNAESRRYGTCLELKRGTFPRSKPKASRQTRDVPDYRCKRVLIGDKIPCRMIQKLCMSNALIRICADLRLTTIPA